MGRGSLPRSKGKKLSRPDILKYRLEGLDRRLRQENLRKKELEAKPKPMTKEEFRAAVLAEREKEEG